MDVLWWTTKEDGLMVGGYNAQQGYLKSVEFLSFRAGSSWKELPQLQHARGNRVGVIEHTRWDHLCSERRQWRRWKTGWNPLDLWGPMEYN